MGFDLDKLIAKVKKESEEQQPEAPSSMFQQFGFAPLPARVRTPRDVAREQVRGLFKKLAETVSGREYLKGPGLAVLTPESSQGIVHYVEWPDPAWQVEVDAATPEAAAKLGRRVLRNLRGKRSLSAAVRYVYDWPLFVIYDTGYVRLEPVVRDRLRSVSGTAAGKSALLVKARGTFGKRGASLSGNERDGYNLALRPALKKMRGVFSGGTLRGTLVDLDVALDSAIAQVNERLSR